mmetsp:Transcript_58802/g.164181  ORF Transcript_58802/g.164181 Transcript_58802/m.164181 type:complete len:281 (+) Transcript_58802:1174-2016(+)
MGGDRSVGGRRRHLLLRPRRQLACGARGTGVGRRRSQSEVRQGGQRLRELTGPTLQDPGELRLEQVHDLGPVPDALVIAPHHRRNLAHVALRRLLRYAALGEVKKHALVLFDTVPAVPRLVREHRPQRLELVVDEVREAELRRRGAFALWTLDLGHEDNVLLLEARQLAESASFVEPLLNLAVHGPTRPHLAHKERVLRSETSHDTPDRVERTGRFPAPVPLVNGPHARVALPCKNAAYVNAESRRGTQRLGRHLDARGGGIRVPGKALVYHGRVLVRIL